jgi:hypothetical protein
VPSPAHVHNNLTLFTDACLLPFARVCLSATYHPHSTHNKSMTLDTYHCIHTYMQSPAKLSQLSGSPQPKVERGGLVSSSRLRKLGDTTATDACQSIFVPGGVRGRGCGWREGRGLGLSACVCQHSDCIAASSSTVLKQGQETV